MKGKSSFRIILLVILFLMLPSGIIATIEGAQNEDNLSVSNSTDTDAPYVPGELIIKYTDGRVAALAATGVGPASLEPLGAEVAEDFSSDGLSGLQALSINEDVSVLDAITELEESPYVAYAEPNYIISLSLPEDPEPADADDPSALSALSYPNDPKFSEQWGLSNTGQTGGKPDADIHAEEGWDTTTGSSSIIVAVLDTGVDYTHADLAANIWTNPGEIPGNGIDDDQNGYIDDVRGWDFINNDNDPMDDNGHGTHCAGVIGAVGNNGVGITGIGWNVKIMPLKFLKGDGNGDTAAALNAIAYARNMGADVVSCSWGGSARSQALGDVISATNILFPCAAGNSGEDNDAGPHFPSNFDYPQIMAVAASNANDGIPSFSNYGATTVDVAAPGDAILSTYPSSMGYQYVKMKGTSMATPHVSGLAAVLLSVNPTLTPARIKEIIISSVDKLPAFTGKTVSGGRINVAQALSLATGGTTKTYTITASAGTGGSISPSGAVSVTGGTTKTFAISPSTGYTISGLIIDGVSTAAKSSYSFTNIAADHTINAQFTQTSVQTVIALPGNTNVPRDINGDGRYEDLNGNGRLDFSDVVLFFKNIDWISSNEPTSAFDFSHNGRIDFTDVVNLFQSIS